MRDTIKPLIGLNTQVILNSECEAWTVLDIEKSGVTLGRDGQTKKISLKMAEQLVDKVVN